MARNRSQQRAIWLVGGRPTETTGGFHLRTACVSVCCSQDRRCVCVCVSGRGASCVGPLLEREQVGNKAWEAAVGAPCRRSMFLWICLVVSSIFIPALGPGRTIGRCGMCSLSSSTCCLSGVQTCVCAFEGQASNVWHRDLSGKVGRWRPVVGGYLGS